MTDPSRAALADEWPKAGDLMRFLDKNGHDWQLEQARKLFVVGGVYTVENSDVGDWDHDIEFKEVEGRFNGVMFERVEIVPVSRAPLPGRLDCGAWQPIETTHPEGGPQYECSDCGGSGCSATLALPRAIEGGADQERVCAHESCLNCVCPERNFCTGTYYRVLSHHNTGDGK